MAIADLIMVAFLLFVAFGGLWLLIVLGKEDIDE
jgi:hypothetical protein